MNPYGTHWVIGGGIGGGSKPNFYDEVFGQFVDPFGPIIDPLVVTAGLV